MTKQKKWKRVCIDQQVLKKILKFEGLLGHTPNQILEFIFDHELVDMFSLRKILEREYADYPTSKPEAG